MQNTLKIAAGSDARRNNDKAFESRANQCQKRDMERQMTRPIAAGNVQESMFDDVKPANAAGQVSLF